MVTHARLALLAVPLLVAGSVAGVLLAGGSLDEGFTLGSADAASDGRCSVADFAFPDDASVKSWSGDVPANASGGTLEVYAYDGGVDVSTWDKSKWRVEVAEVDSQDRLEPKVDASVEGGAFSLTVTFQDNARREVGPLTTSVSVGEDPRAHVRVRVPDEAYDAARADSHPNANDSVDLDINLEVPDDPTQPENHTHNPVLVQDLQAAKVAARSRDGDAAVAGVAGDQVTVTSRDGAAVADDVQAESLEVTSRDGDACAQEADVGQASLRSRDGDVAGILRTAKLEASSRDGSVALGLVPTDSGSADVSSRDGDVTLHVATGENIGYEVQAESRDGDVEVDLPNATVTEDSSDDGESATARTHGFDSRPIAFDLTAESRDGDVTVAAR